jgi:hypothetical protein
MILIFFFNSNGTENFEPILSLHHPPRSEEKVDSPVSKQWPHESWTMEALELFFNSFHVSESGKDALLQILQDPLFCLKDVKKSPVLQSQVSKMHTLCIF